MVFVRAWDETYGGLMLLNLVDLINIFKSWVMGISQQFIKPSRAEGIFIVFRFVMALSIL